MSARRTIFLLAATVCFAGFAAAYADENRFGDEAVSDEALDASEEAPAPKAPEDDAETANLLIGSWKSMRHIVDYRADGTYAVDPKESRTTPSGTWKVLDGFLLKQPSDGAPQKIKILSATRDEIVLEAENGRAYRITRVPTT